MDQQQTQEGLSPEIEQQITHALTAFGSVLNDLNDAGVHPAAVATAMSNAFVGYMATTAALFGKSKEDLMPTVIAAFEALTPYAHRVFDEVTGELANIKDKPDEQQ